MLWMYVWNGRCRNRIWINIWPAPYSLAVWSTCAALNGPRCIKLTFRLRCSCVHTHLMMISIHRALSPLQLLYIRWRLDHAHVWSAIKVEIQMMTDDVTAHPDMWWCWLVETSFNILVTCNSFGDNRAGVDHSITLVSAEGFYCDHAALLSLDGHQQTWDFWPRGHCHASGLIWAVWIGFKPAQLFVQPDSLSWGLSLLYLTCVNIRPVSQYVV